VSSPDQIEGKLSGACDELACPKCNIVAGGSKDDRCLRRNSDEADGAVGASVQLSYFETKI